MPRLLALPASCRLLLWLCSSCTGTLCHPAPPKTERGLSCKHLRDGHSSRGGRNISASVLGSSTPLCSLWASLTLRLPCQKSGVSPHGKVWGSGDRVLLRSSARVRCAAAFSRPHDHPLLQCLLAYSPKMGPSPVCFDSRWSPALLASVGSVPAAP